MIEKRTICRRPTCIVWLRPEDLWDKRPTICARGCWAASGNQQSGVRQRASSGGFTLIEAALTTVIVGTGVLSIVAAQQAYHRKNDWSQRIGTAVLLANELRELTLTLPIYDPLYGTAQLGPRANQTTVASYDNVCDFAGTVSGVGTGMTFSPPINALAQQIPSMSNWSQTINVTNVLPDNINATLTQPLGTTQMVRVTVSINYTDPRNTTTTLYTTSWIVAQQSMSSRSRRRKETRDERQPP